MHWSLIAKSQQNRIDLVTRRGSLTEKMLSVDPNMRPPASAVLKHPIFWSIDKRLTFLQEASDRVDMETKDSALVEILERGRGTVLGHNLSDSNEPGMNTNFFFFRTSLFKMMAEFWIKNTRLNPIYINGRIFKRLPQLLLV